MLGQIDQIQGIGFHLDVTLRQIQEAYIKVFIELQIDITIEQWVLLHRIYQNGGSMPQRELVHINFRNRATTSRVLSRLENKGLVVKNRFEGDAKQYNLVLTKEGVQLIEGLLPKAKELRKKAFVGIDEEDLKIFLTVLESVRKNYGEFF